MLKPGHTGILAAICHLGEYYGRHGFVSSTEFGCTIQYIKDLARSVLPEYVPHENPEAYESDESKSFSALVDGYLSWLERIANNRQC